MQAGCRDFQRPACQGLAAYIGQIRRCLGVGLVRNGIVVRGARQQRLAAQVGNDRRQVGGAMQGLQAALSGLGQVAVGQNEHATYKMKVSITGRGRVVAQYPLAGSPLHGANECALTLDER